MESVTIPLWALPPTQPSDGGELERAATATIEALRAQNAIQPWHELDCQIVLDLSRAVAASKGIAKSQMFAALLAARAKLPEPVVTETDGELIEYEAERELAWVRAHELANPADIQDAEIIE
jgi:hypothetical protein